MTIRDYMNDGDNHTLDEIDREYDYLIGQKFELMTQRDSLISTRRSVVDVTRQINLMTDRLRYLDARRQTISRVPCINYAYGINPKDTRTAKVWDLLDFEHAGIRIQSVAKRGRPRQEIVTKYVRGNRLVDVEVTI